MANKWTERARRAWHGDRYGYYACPEHKMWVRIVGASHFVRKAIEQTERDHLERFHGTGRYQSGKPE